MNKRFPLLDLLRGVAIVLMVAFHFRHLYLHVFFQTLPWDFPPGVWVAIGPVGASLFILIAGFSFIFPMEQGVDMYRYGRQRFLLLGACAGLITLVTYFFFPRELILFGILHFFAIGFLLLPFFLRFGYGNAIIGGVFIAIGFLLGRLDATNPYLFWLGYHTRDFYSADYYPVFPWFGILLLGFVLGKVFRESPTLQRFFSRSF